MENNFKKKAVIIGAGPAGLTVAHQLLEKTDIQPIIYEMDNQIGGLSRTINYKGNRIDIGGHRFFSKFDKVTSLWKEMLPLQQLPAKDDLILQREVLFESKCNQNSCIDPEKNDQVMLLRNRLSRILFLRKFFDYPVSLKLNTLKNLGFYRTSKIGCSYLKTRILPIKNEKSLEDFFINRFGTELYKTFFKDYTQKVWGVPCNKISASWGAQRVKGLSISKAILHAMKLFVVKNKSVEQKTVETSLINRFMYPKFGPGQMWEEFAKSIEQKGGQIHLEHEVVGIETNLNKVTTIKVKSKKTSDIFHVQADYVFSCMPVRELVNSFETEIDHKVKSVAQGLLYRDFMTVGLLLKKLKIKNTTPIKTLNNLVPDNWIYVQEPDVKVGRMQIFNNWSPYMVQDLDNVWIGLEYFCNQGDELWNKNDKDFIDFAVDEMIKIGVLEKDDLLDAVVVRMPKAYPAYFGTYDNFGVVKKFLNKFENLFLVGRNGMHRYNNMDHSMLTAMTAVQNIIDGISTKDNIWSVNSEEDYHEEKRS
jgi:protoporphyrinogen oxidase